MIIELLKGTPWWVYLLLAVLISMGVNACRTREIHLIKIFIFPIIFMVLCAFKIQNIPVFIACFVISIAIGWMAFNHAEVKVDKAKHVIKVPGSIIPLVLITFAFLKGYFVGYETEVNPQVLELPVIHWALLISSGCFAGMMFGRTALYVYKYVKA